MIYLIPILLIVWLLLYVRKALKINSLQMIDEVNEAWEVSQDVQHCINCALKNRGSDNPKFDFAMIYILSHVFMKELNILGFKLWVSRAEDYYL